MSDDSGEDTVGGTFGSAAGSMIAGPIGAAYGAYQGMQNPYRGVPSATDNSAAQAANILKTRNKYIQQIEDNANLDTYSKRQLMDRIAKTTNPYAVADFDILAEISKAEKGEGMYGANRKNAELVKQMNEKPGRRQTILTQGAKAVSGTESTGLLTGVPKV